jgi:hypothetical protein
MHDIKRNLRSNHTRTWPISFADKAKIVYSPAEVFLAFGKPGTLDCHFHANPPLTKIRWEKDGFLFDTYNVPEVYHKLNGSLYFNRVIKKLLFLKFTRLI